MPPAKANAEAQLQKEKLANSYSALLEEFSSKELRRVGTYTLGKIIGKGSFGKVYFAKHDLTNGTKVVLKASKKDDANLAREIHHHRQFIHPHIARLYEVIVTETQVWLALEYCQGDELYHYLTRKGALPIETAQKIFTQLVGAVTYIHSKSCVHRDLKLENVLLDKHENVKLCDFGFTREYAGSSNYLQTFCGTVCYSAPEMLRGEKYAGEKVDVWSLGIILYALLRGQLPFDDDDERETKNKILKEDPVYPDGFPDGAKTLISKLLSKRPLHRPTLSEILMDPFLAEHAPHQQAILKLSQPAPFTTTLEKETIERMRSVGVNIDQVIESVLSQKCDVLSGWWALLIEKEQRKEARRERKRKEREAELKILRRLSGASGRLDKIAPTLVEVDEGEQRSTSADRVRSGSRGRTHRRSTPQILVSDLPQLPEGSAIVSPGAATPPPPLDKDSVRSPSVTRPLLPPKDRKRRSSTLQIVTNSPDLLGHTNGITKRRFNKRPSNQFLKQLTAIKHWFVDSAKRAKSPGKSPPTTAATRNGGTNDSSTPTLSPPGHDRLVSSSSAVTRSSFGAALTPTTSHTGPNTFNGHISLTRDPKLDTSRVNHRNSISPSPITPRSSYRHSSAGLRGRKSTSSSISSVRSMPRHTKSHSKASSVSSNSMDNIHSPGSRSIGRSPHPSIKVLPVTPTGEKFPSNVRFVRGSSSSHTALGSSSSSDTVLVVTPDSSNPNSTQPAAGFMFARRKKSAFRGAMLSSSGFFGSTYGIPAGQGSPAFPRPRDGSDGKMNLSLRDGASGRRGSKGGKRKSQIIEEEDEDGEVGEEEEVEEVDAFSPVEEDLGRGERLQSITLWDDPPSAGLEETGKEKELVGIGIGIGSGNRIAAHAN